MERLARSKVPIRDELAVASVSSRSSTSGGSRHTDIWRSIVQLLEKRRVKAGQPRRRGKIGVWEAGWKSGS
jgi:hypothetical protein